MLRFLFCSIIIITLSLAYSPALFGQSNAINQHQLQELLRFSDSTGANKVMLIHDSAVIGSFNSSQCDSVYMNTASMVKAWTGLAVGILIDKGLVESENEEICQYLPEWASGCKRNVTIKHLLTMSSGLLKIRPASSSILAQDDMTDFALGQQIKAEPGTKFSYSNEGVQMLGLLIERASGQNAESFFMENLFMPLGMDSTSLWRDSAGNDIVYGGAKTTLQDASKIGLLMLNKGKYNGRRIVSEEWIQKSTTPSESAAHYGYLWWLSPSHQNTPMENYAAMGDFGQLTIVFPNKRLIYLRQQSCRNSDASVNMSWMGVGFLEMIGNVIEN